MLASKPPGECVKSVTIKSDQGAGKTVPIRVRCQSKDDALVIKENDVADVVSLLMAQDFAREMMGLQGADKRHVKSCLLSAASLESAFSANDTITVTVEFADGPDSLLELYTFDFTYLIPGQSPLTRLNRAAVKLRVPRAASNESQSSMRGHLIHLIESPLFRQYLCDGSAHAIPVDPSLCSLEVVEMDLNEGAAVLSVNFDQVWHVV